MDGNVDNKPPSQQHKHKPQIETTLRKPGCRTPRTIETYFHLGETHIYDCFHWRLHGVETHRVCLLFKPVSLFCRLRLMSRKISQNFHSFSQTVPCLVTFQSRSQQWFKLQLLREAFLVFYSVCTSVLTPHNVIFAPKWFHTLPFSVYPLKHLNKMWIKTEIYALKIYFSQNQLEFDNFG